MAWWEAVKAVGSGAMSLGNSISALRDLGRDKQGSKHAFSDLMASAKNAGIHPLFALGASANIQPQWQAGSQLGTGIAGLGATASSIADSMDASNRARIAAGEKPQRDALEQAQLHALQASASRDEAAAQLSLSEVAVNNQKVNSTGTGRGIEIKDAFGNYIVQPPQVTPSRPGDPSLSAGPAQPAMIEVTDPWGRKTAIPNQNLTDSDLPGAILMLQQMLKEGSNAATNWWHENSKYHKPFLPNPGPPKPSKGHLYYGKIQR